MLQISDKFEFPIDPQLPRFVKISSWLGIGQLGDYDFPEIVNQTQVMVELPNLSLKILNYQYILNCQIKDLNDNLLLSIIDNKWKIERETVERYNYDEKGIELYDKSNRIYFNLNFVPSDAHTNQSPALYMQGLLTDLHKSVAYYRLNTNTVHFQRGDQQGEKAFWKFVDEHPISPIFRYSGSGWEHSRANK